MHIRNLQPFVSAALFVWGLCGIVFLMMPTTANAKVLSDSGWHISASEEVAIAGDVNGDGYDDILVWNESADEVQLYRGNSSGAGSSHSWAVSVTSHNYRDVEGVGDINGDGYDDVMVGEPNLASSQNPSSARARLFLGSPNGLSSQADWDKTIEESGFGWSIDGGGDINGDGYDDVVIGNPAYGMDPYNWCSSSTPVTVPSSVHVFFGGSDGLAQTADWTYKEASTHPSCIGFDVAIQGDVNGDGLEDVVATAPNEETTSNSLVRGNVHLFYGSQQGQLSTSPDHTVSTPSPSYLTEVTTSGDVNGDGIDDILVQGSKAPDAQTGVLRLYYGANPNPPTLPDWSYPNKDSASYAINTTMEMGVADIDDDGYADLVVPSYMSGYGRRMLHGSPSGPIEPPAWGLNVPSSASAYYNQSVGTGGDVNGDGYNDVVFETTGSGTFLYLGGPNPPPSAQAATVSTGQGVPTELSLEATDPHDDPITYAIETEPSDGSLTGLDAEAGAVTYEPDAGFYGEDSFEFRAEDPYGNTDTATVTVRMEPDNEPPEFVEPTPETMLQVRAGELLEFQVQAEDPDGDEITYEVVPVPDGASFEPASGDFTWRPPVGRAGESISMTLRADDGITTILREITLQITEPADTGVDAGMDAGESTADVSADAGDVAEPNDSTAETSNQGCGCRSGGDAGSVGLSLVVLLMMVVGRGAWGVVRRA